MLSLIPLRSQIFARSLPNAKLAFAILAVTSSSMSTALESVQGRRIYRQLSVFVHYYESGWTAKLGHDFPEVITTNFVKSFGKVDKRHVKIYILFLAFLQKLSCGEDHVYCPSVFSESTLTFWDKSLLIKMNIQAIQQNFCQYLPSNGLEGDASVLVTDLRISFQLV